MQARVSGRPYYDSQLMARLDSTRWDSRPRSVDKTEAECPEMWAADKVQQEDRMEGTWCVCWGERV